MGLPAGDTDPFYDSINVTEVEEVWGLFISPLSKD